MGGWFNKRGKKGTVKLDTTIEYIVHEQRQRWRVELLQVYHQYIQHTTGGRWHKQRRPPPAEHAVHTHVFDRINVIRYLFGASNQQDSRTMTIPKPTNEMAMVHLDGWTDRTDSRAHDVLRFSFAPAISFFPCESNLVCRSATDRQSNLKETRSTVN